MQSTMTCPSQVVRHRQGVSRAHCQSSGPYIRSDFNSLLTSAQDIILSGRKKKCRRQSASPCVASKKVSHAQKTSQRFGRAQTSSCPTFLKFERLFLSESSGRREGCAPLGRENRTEHQGDKYTSTIVGGTLCTCQTGIVCLSLLLLSIIVGTIYHYHCRPSSSLLSVIVPARRRYPCFSLGVWNKRESHFPTG